MKEEDFWLMIDGACEYAGRKPFKNNELKVQFLFDSLSKLSKDNVFSFERHLTKKVVELDHYNILALYKIIDGYITDDPYLYFRYELVMQGKIIFDTSIDDTDSMVNFIETDSEINGECFITISDEVYGNLYGSGVYPRDQTNDISGDTSGIRWEIKDLSIHFPKLFNKFFNPQNDGANLFP